MNTKLIMTLSAIFMAIIGISLSFLPDEILKYSGMDSTALARIILQLLGALYFAFAMLNWMAKGATIGGIYNKPISIANFTHFFIGGLALLKALIKYTGTPQLLWVLAVIYLVFAICFGIVFTRHPADKQAA
jgi:Fe2+ transport system protein B